MVPFSKEQVRETNPNVIRDMSDIEEHTPPTDVNKSQKSQRSQRSQRSLRSQKTARQQKGDEVDENKPLVLLPRYEPIAVLENQVEETLHCDICLSIDWEDND